MLDISKYKLPTQVQPVGKKLDQYIALMDLKGRADYAIVLYDEDYETLNRFTRKVTGEKYTLQTVNWKGHKVTKGGIKK